MYAHWSMSRERTPRWIGSEAEVILKGQQVTVQLFVRLCYSAHFCDGAPDRRGLFAGHVAAFEHLGGVPSD
ncbi:MAG: hypothetical protein U0401_10385 [Anaerolineae bacterium]